MTSTQRQGPAAAAVPFLDLQAQYRAIRPEIDAAIARVLASGQFVLGPEGKALEGEIAARCGTTHGIGVASGTDALELALRACDIGPGDEVITTPFSFIATAEAIAAVGATIVFADIEPGAYGLDPQAVAAHVTPKTRAMIPVHLYGHPCDMDALTAIAQRHNLTIIEDCAQAIGARLHDRPVGSFGMAGCLSFYPTKNLGAYGDGGMIVTRDEALAQRTRLLRHHGDRARYDHVIIGRNSRLDELQAAVLRAKLSHLDAWTAARRRLAALYTRLLAPLRDDGVVLPEARPECVHAFHAYTVRCPNRDDVARRLAEQGIATQVYYPTTLTHQPALRQSTRAHPACPSAERASHDVLSLPLYPELADADVERVAAGLSEVVRRR